MSMRNGTIASVTARGLHEVALIHPASISRHGRAERVPSAARLSQSRTHEEPRMHSQPTTGFIHELISLHGTWPTNRPEDLHLR